MDQTVHIPAKPAMKAQPEKLPERVYRQDNGVETILTVQVKYKIHLDSFIYKSQQK